MNTLRLPFYLLSILYAVTCCAQGSREAKGREFWLGFMRNYEGAMDLRVYISSEVATTATVSAPHLGWSQNVSVAANGTAEVYVPTYVEHYGSEFVDNKGILVTTEDSCTVYAFNHDEFTADASLILPTHALGRAYIVQAYAGLVGYNSPSEALIVCASDSSEIEIIPSTGLIGGHQAWAPFTIMLHQGESYQLQAITSAGDLTGTRVRAISSEVCNPFAVFGGSACADVPYGCYACDHLFEQSLPTTAWGQRYFITPFTMQTSYTFRVLAGNDPVTVEFDGIPLNALGAGQSYEMNFVNGAHCLTGDAPFSVAMFMQGSDCGGGFSDPAMLIVNKDEEVATHVAFSTITSPNLFLHWVNVVTTAGNETTMMVDSIPVDTAAFFAFPECPDHVWASIQITQGPHTITAATGFSAYVYGTGPAWESYAYALGTTITSAVDTLICYAGGPITLAAPDWMNDPYWYPANDPFDTLAIGPTYTFDPGASVVIVAAEIGGSTCVQEQRYHIEFAPAFIVEAAALPSPICWGDTTMLIASIIPPVPGVNIVWTPAVGVLDPYSATTLAVPTSNTVYTATASTNQGCFSTTGSILVTVNPLPFPLINMNGNILSTDEYATYQWYLDGVAIPGANAQVLEAVVSGNYTVVVTDDNGCTGYSGIAQVIVTSVEEPGIMSALAFADAGDVVVVTPEDGLTIELYDVLGQRIAGSLSKGGHVRMPVPSEGTYFVRIHGKTSDFTKRVVVLRR